MRYFIQTFGCKSNQYESAAVRELLDNAGHTEAANARDADVYIANTCAVTGRAGASCRNAIRRTVRENPSLRVILTGCGVDLDEQFPDLPSGRPVLVPNAKKHSIPCLLADMDRTMETVGEAAENRFGLAISAFHGHTRAFLKIQDGCDNFCSYCAVPYARGVPESRPSMDVLAEAKRLVQNGHREIVLTGINIGAYNRDGLDLAGLVAGLAGTPGLGRLRLGSVEPPYLTDDLVQVMANEEAVCPHIHLPLQSGDDAVLQAMRRRYTSGEFMDKVALLRDRLNRPAITTDIIVGFPGEDDAAAERSLVAARRAGFSRLHVFLFSPRPGTPAATMRQTASNADIDAWKKNLIQEGSRLAETFAESCVGMDERMILEQNGSGLTDRYVTVRANDATPNELIQIRITHAEGPTLQAKRRDMGTGPE